MKNITFRPARPEDAEALFKIKIAAYSDEFRQFNYADYGYPGALKDCSEDGAKDGGFGK